MLLVTYQLKIDNPSNQSCFSPASPPTFTKKKCVVYLPSTLSPLVESRFFFKVARKATSLDFRCQLKNHLMDVVSFDVCQCVVLKFERKYFHWRCRVGGITASGLLFFEVTVCCAQQVFTSLLVCWNTARSSMLFPFIFMFLCIVSRWAKMVGHTKQLGKQCSPETYVSGWTIVGNVFNPQLLIYVIWICLSF